MLGTNPRTAIRTSVAQQAWFGYGEPPALDLNSEFSIAGNLKSTGLHWVAVIVTAARDVFSIGKPLDPVISRVGIIERVVCEAFLYRRSQKGECKTSAEKPKNCVA